MWRDDPLLGGLALVFVLILPGAHLLALTVRAILRWLDRGGPWVARLGVLEEWSMLDVFSLALLVVLAKLGDLAEVSARPGAAALLASAVLATVAARRLRAA